MTMGLGKSLTAVVHSLCSIKPSCSEKKGENGFPTLVVTSKTVMDEWKSQCFEKFFDERVQVLYLHPDVCENLSDVSRSDIVEYDFVLTTYEVCCSAAKKMHSNQSNKNMSMKRNEIPLRSRSEANDPSITGIEILYFTPWERVICDESHRFANPSTAVFRAIIGLYGRYKWGLTGTPIRNHETDLWSQLRFCGYSTIPTPSDWKKYGPDAMILHNLNKAIFSMSYETAGIYLPVKTFHDYFLEDIDKKNYTCYQLVLSRAREIYDSLENGDVSYSQALALFTRLRQCCIAPYLMTTASKREKGNKTEQHLEKETSEKIQRNFGMSTKMQKWLKDPLGTAGIKSPKIEKILEILEEIDPKEKVIVFSMFTSALDLLAKAITSTLPKMKYEQMDGDTPSTERLVIRSRFQNDSRFKVLLMTYKVGSEGLNLTAANHVICIEPWWTEAVQDQGISRVWRLGQCRPVHIHRIFIRGTIEDNILEKCRDKNLMAKDMLTASEVSLSDLVKRGAGLDKISMGQILGINK